MFEHEFYTAASYGNLADIKTYIGRIDDLEVTGQKALYGAIENGHLHIVTFLAAHHHTYHQAAFLHAISFGHLDIVQFFCAHTKVDLTYSHHMPIRLAAGHGHLPIVQFLCTFPVVDPAGYLPPFDLEQCETSIFMAAKSGHLPVVEFLYERLNIDPKRNLAATTDGTYKVQDAFYYSFTEAISYGHLPVVQFFAARIPQDRYLTPMERDEINFAFAEAARDGYLDVVQFMSDHPFINHQAALKMAARNNHLPIVQHLCNHLAAKCIATGRGIRSIHKIPAELADEIISFLYPAQSNWGAMARSSYKAKSKPPKYQGWGRTGDVLANNIREQSLLFSIHHRKAQQLNAAATSIKSLWRGYKVRKQLQVDTRATRLLM